MFWNTTNFTEPSSIDIRAKMYLRNDIPGEYVSGNLFGSNSHINLNYCSDSTNQTSCSVSLTTWSYSFPSQTNHEFVTLDSDADDDKDTIEFHILSGSSRFVAAIPDDTSGECQVTEGCSGGSIGPVGGGGGGAEDEPESIEKEECPYECCLNENLFLDKSCVEGFVCEDRKCVSSEKISPQLNKIFFGVILVVIFYIFFLKPKTKVNRKK